MRNIEIRAGISNSVLARRGSLARNRRADHGRRVALVVLSILWVVFLDTPLHGREHKKREDFRLGFSTEITASESEVLQVVQAIVDNGIIQGSFEYNKDKYIEHAAAAKSSSLFPEWKDPGTVFYKVRTKVLAPANFKDAKDEGTLAVRYIVQSRDADRTILRIDAIFVEDFHPNAHPSDGTVESAEYKDIQDHVDALELAKSQAQQSEKHRQEELARQVLERKSEEDEALALAAAQTSVQGLEQHVEDLRRRAERLIRAPGAQLKSAPYH